MKQYTNYVETPLKFHKFFWYVMLPLGFIMTISNAGVLFEQGALNWVVFIDPLHIIADLALRLVVFFGFFHRKPFAWYGVMAFLALVNVYNIYLLVVFALLIPDQAPGTLIQLAVGLAYTIPICIYYMKRRRLFFPGQSL